MSIRWLSSLVNDLIAAVVTLRGDVWLYGTVCASPLTEIVDFGGFVINVVKIALFTRVRQSFWDGMWLLFVPLA